MFLDMDYTGREATEQWYGEIKDFDSHHCAEFNPKTGHFTQLIWVGTTHIGAAMANDKNGKHYVCARYHPPGNLKGNFEKNLHGLDEEEEESVGGTIKENGFDANEDVEKFKRDVEFGTCAFTTPRVSSAAFDRWIARELCVKKKQKILGTRLCAYSKCSHCHPFGLMCEQTSFPGPADLLSPCAAMPFF